LDTVENNDTRALGYVEMRFAAAAAYLCSKFYIFQIDSSLDRSVSLSEFWNTELSPTTSSPIAITRERVQNPKVSPIENVRPEVLKKPGLKRRLFSPELESISKKKKKTEQNIE
jgi:hypothetical protein